MTSPPKQVMDLAAARYKYNYLARLLRDHPDDRAIRWDYKQAQAVYLRLKAKEKKR